MINVVVLHNITVLMFVLKIVILLLVNVSYKLLMFRNFRDAAFDYQSLYSYLHHVTAFDDVAQVLGFR